MPELSVVLPSYNEEKNVAPIAAKLTQVLEGAGIKNFEIIFVDDGSHDATPDEVRTLAARDSRVRLIRLVRNFGHQGALMAGLHSAKGSAVITMDADFQHPPELIPQMIERWRCGAQVVQMIRSETPGEGWVKKFTSRTFYRAFQQFSGIPIRSGQADFRLLDRSVIDHLVSMREKIVFLRGLLAWYGFTTVNLPYQAAERFTGTSKFTFAKMLRLASEGITSFSVAPLRLLAGIGLATSLGALAYALYALLVKLLGNNAVPGWTSVTVLLSIFSAMQFVFLAVLAQYISVIIGELKARPAFLIGEDSDQQPKKLAAS